MRLFVLSAAGLAALAAPAAAAEKCFDKATLSYVDCPQPAPIRPVQPAPAPVAPAEPIQPWSGFYIGAHGGYAWSDVEGATGLGAVSEDADGFLAGGQVGFLKQYDSNLVLGLEVDGSGVFGDDDSGTREAELNFLSSARVRVGYAADRFMPYVTGGVALADWDYSEPGVSVSDTTVGAVAGGGVEILADENWMVRGEGLYYFLDDDQSVPGGEVGIDDAVVGRIGLTYKF